MTERRALRVGEAAAELGIHPETLRQTVRDAVTDAVAELVISEGDLRAQRVTKGSFDKTEGV